MEAPGLPETIVRAWGPEVATDFLHWIEERVTLFGPQIQISAFVARQQVNVLIWKWMRITAGLLTMTLHWPASRTWQGS